MSRRYDPHSVIVQVTSFFGKSLSVWIQVWNQLSLCLSLCLPFSMPIFASWARTWQCEYIEFIENLHKFMRHTSTHICVCEGGNDISRVALHCCEAMGAKRRRHRSWGSLPSIFAMYLHFLFTRLAPTLLSCSCVPFDRLTSTHSRHNDLYARNASNSENVCLGNTCVGFQFKHTFCIIKDASGREWRDSDNILSSIFSRPTQQHWLVYKHLCDGMLLYASRHTHAHTHTHTHLKTHAIVFYFL